MSLYHFPAGPCRTTVFPLRPSPMLCVWLAGIAFATLITGCPTCECQDGQPSISFTNVPGLGSSASLRGRTECVSPADYRVVVYICVDGTWWVKPTEAAPLTTIGPLTCEWEADVTTNGEDQTADTIMAFIVPSDYDADLHALPGDDVSLASAIVRRTETTCAIDDCEHGDPTIQFTDVPALGSPDNARGLTTGVDRTAFGVVVYICVDGTWWVKPTAAEPVSSIRPGCAWKADITTADGDELADEIRAFVVPASYAAAMNTLPPEDVLIASASVTRGNPTCDVVVPPVTQARDLVAELKTKRVVAYAPTNFDPTQGVFPTEASIRADLRTLAEHGFEGVVTYDIAGTLGDIPRLASEAGMTVVVAGVFDPTDSEAIERAVSLATYVDGYVVGNEGLEGGRYTLDQLRSAIEDLRSRTNKPVTTSEGPPQYDAVLGLLAIGDWVFPNIHPWWAGQRESQGACTWTEAQYEALVERGEGVLVALKETGLPTCGDSEASEGVQAAFYRCLEDTDVVFVYFEAFDQPWKRDQPVEPCWGLFQADRSPKLVVAGGTESTTDDARNNQKSGTRNTCIIGFSASSMPGEWCAGKQYDDGVSCSGVESCADSRDIADHDPYPAG